MPDLYPLRLVPEFSPRPWGTRDLRPIYSDAPGTEPIGEAWLTGDNCKVANGAFAGATLGELCKRFGRELVGEAAPQADRFPLLIKFLFPRDKLSVQVHPDDDAARAAGQPCGKTECWYVLHAEPGAQVALGLKPGTTKAQFEHAIREQRAEQLLNWVDIHAGEVIYVDAGTVHAIGPGSILVETQQNSDTTFRLYDYGRPRELHIEQGMKAMKERTRAGKVKPSRGDDSSESLIASCYFTVNHYRLLDDEGWISVDNRPENCGQTVEIIVALAGRGVVEADSSEPVNFERGQAVVVPAAIASFLIKPQPHLQALSMSLPAAGVPAHPTTYLEETAAREGNGI